MLLMRKQKRQPLAAFFGLCKKLLLADAVLLTEFLNTASRVDNFLRARIERVAGRADFNMQRLVHRGTGGEIISATASYGNFVVLGVNACFHIALPGSEPGKRGIIHKNPWSGKRLPQNR